MFYNFNNCLYDVKEKLLTGISMKIWAMFRLLKLQTASVTLLRIQFIAQNRC